MKKWLLSAGLANSLSGLDFAAASDVLSFSALEVNGRKHFIRVLSVSDEEVSYVNLTEQLKHPLNTPFDLFKGKSFTEVKDELNKLSGSPRKTTYSQLSLAFTPREHHLCAGLNYRDHVAESGQKNEVVLFPKFGTVTTHGAKIPFRANSPLPELLDYEVELGVIFDRDIRMAGDIDNAVAGFFVANDFSDRAPQIYFYGDQPQHDSYSFAAAKSKTGFSIISPLLVIPQDWSSFAQNLRMELSVNGELKQKSSTANMSISLAKMLELALAPTALRWPLLAASGTELNEQIRLPLVPLDAHQKPYIPAQTIFMTGTPGGTLFQKPSLGALAKAFFKIPVQKFAVTPTHFKKKLKASLIANESQSGKYLRAGDHVESRIEHLGTLNFSVIAADP